MSMPPDFNAGVHDTKTEPITPQLAILPPPYLWTVVEIELVKLMVTIFKGLYS